MKLEEFKIKYQKEIKEYLKISECRNEKLSLQQLNNIIGFIPSKNNEIITIDLEN